MELYVLMVSYPLSHVITLWACSVSGLHCHLSAAWPSVLHCMPVSYCEHMGSVGFLPCKFTVMMNIPQIVISGLQDRTFLESSSRLQIEILNF